MTITLPEGTNTLNLKESPHALRLAEAYGGAKVTLTLDVSSNVDEHAASLQLTAELVAGPSTINMTPLCTATADRLVTPYKTSTSISFTGIITLDALRALEDTRDGGAVHLALRNVRGIMVGTKEQRLLEGGGGEVHVKVPASTWAEEFERVTSATSFSLLVSAGDDEDLAEATRHLNKARSQLRRGTVDSGTATEIRLALEVVRAAYTTTRGIKEVRDKAPQQRNAQERWAIMVEDAISLTSGYVHTGAESLQDTTLTRAIAAALVHQAAGMLARLAVERHAGLV